MQSMIKSKYVLPLYKHPTTIMLVDDNEEFLQAMTTQFKDDYYITGFSNPFKARESLNTERDIFKEKYINIMEANSLEEVVVSVNYFGLDLEINNSKKSEVISTLLIDYDMPGMNGLEFCRTVNAENVTKILLSGNIKDKEVIEAFNHGIIDGYIEKSHPNLISEIEKIIVKSEEAYFSKLSAFCSQAILLDNDRPSYLGNPQYICFFNQLVKENEIAEYYLFDRIGSYLLKSKDGKLSKLYLSDQDSFTTMLELLPDGTSDIVVEGIKGKNKIFCYSENNMLPDKIEDYVYTAFKVPGSRNLHYSLVPLATL